MSDHQTDVHATHDDAHTAHDDAHAVQALGPIDWAAWGMAVMGGALAALVALTLVLAAHP
jgi:hypothetical protein